MSIRDVIVMLQLRNHVSSQRIQNFLEVFLYVIPIKSETFSGKQEKESIIRVRMGWKNPSVLIIVCHHSASLIMPIGDPLDGLFYPTLNFFDGFLYSLIFSELTVLTFLEVSVLDIEDLACVIRFIEFIKRFEEKG